MQEKISDQESNRLNEFDTGVLSGDITKLARAITLIESSKPEHRVMAQALLQRLLPHSGKAQRIGITGIPGVGKSTTIDQLGTNLTKMGHKIAVLAVDPTSSRSGGSILGDKTRMNRLAVDANAYIRPSPTSGTLGGVTRKTRETMALCEAAGFDIIIVETVGVGQSETAVADMVDFFLVLALPGAGDELQGIKKGILEIADMIAVNKADGDNATRAERAALDYKNALHILTPASPNWSPPVLTISGLKDMGLDNLWQAITDHKHALTTSGEYQARRQNQNVKWMHELLEQGLMDILNSRDNVRIELQTLEGEVRDGRVTPQLAVEKLLSLLNLS